MQIGDELRLSVLEENRSWGYKPAPNGTVMKVLGFGVIYDGRAKGCRKPGVYRNRSWVKVEINGKETSIGLFHFEPVDKQKYESRLAEYNLHRHQSEYDFRAEREKDWLGELPETKFWEGDKVLVVGGHGFHDTNIGYIQTVRYENIGDKRDDGTPMPLYDITPEWNASYTTWADEEHLELLERGPVWKYYHGEPIKFENLRQEADFFKRLGMYAEVRNPSDKMYSWTLTEFIEGLKKGLIHDWHGANESTRGNAIKFDDIELGKRVARMNLAAHGYDPNSI